MQTYSPNCSHYISNRNVLYPTLFCHIQNKNVVFPQCGSTDEHSDCHLTECYWTSGAFVRLLSCVSQHMRNQMFSLIEWFVALAAFVWLFSTVDFKCVRKGKNEDSSIYNYFLKCWHYISIIKIYNPPRYILPNCWHDIYNTYKGLQLCAMFQTVWFHINTYIKMYIFHPRARRAHRNCPTYIHPPIVGMIYPIPTKASNCVKCPKLFDFISIRISKCILLTAVYFSLLYYYLLIAYITKLCARRAL